MAVAKVLSCMQRGTRTDERLDNLAAGVDSGFERIDRGFERLERRLDGLERKVVQDGRAEAQGLHAESRTDVAALRGEIDGLREVVRVSTGLIVALVGVIGVVLASVL